MKSSNVNLWLLCFASMICLGSLHAQISPATRPQPPRKTEFISEEDASALPVLELTGDQVRVLAQEFVAGKGEIRTSSDSKKIADVWTNVLEKMSKIDPGDDPIAEFAPVILSMLRSIPREDPSYGEMLTSLCLIYDCRFPPQNPDRRPKWIDPILKKLKDSPPFPGADVLVARVQLRHFVNVPVADFMKENEQIFSKQKELESSFSYLPLMLKAMGVPATSLDKIDLQLTSLANENNLAYNGKLSPSEKAAKFQDLVTRTNAVLSDQNINADQKRLATHYLAIFEAALSEAKLMQGNPTTTNSPGR